MFCRSGNEELWRTVFNQIFEELRNNHPADEWALRLVNELTSPTKGVEASPNPETEPSAEEIVERELINLEAPITVEETQTKTDFSSEEKEVNQEESTYPHQDNGAQDIFYGQTDSAATVTLLSATNLMQADNAERCLDISLQEKATEPLDIQRDQPVEQDSSLLLGHEDNQVDATEIQENQVQAVDKVQLHLEASGEPAKQGIQGESNGYSDEAAEKLQELETGSSGSLEARDRDVHAELERENEPSEALIHNIQDVDEKENREEPNCNETIQQETVQEIPSDQQQEIDEALAVFDGSIETETPKEPVTEAHVVDTEAEAESKVEDAKIEDNIVVSDKENEPIALTEIDQENQQTVDSNGSEKQEPVQIQEIPPIQPEKAVETETESVVNVQTETKEEVFEINIKVEDTNEEENEDKSEKLVSAIVLNGIEIDEPVTDAEVVHVQTEMKDALLENSVEVDETINKQEGQVYETTQEKEADVSQKPDEPIETHFDLESPQAIRVNGEQLIKASEELANDSSLVFNEEKLISDENPPRQLEELEIVPVQVLPPRPPQRLGASSPQLAAGSNDNSQLNGSSSETKKSPGKSQDNEGSRKPEWMRRPLVRKGSVGRLFGRMKVTMQSKRFHHDRLPVVPPPQPEPPKRPPRRKTLANLDLSREPEVTNRDESVLQSPPPATPKSAPVNDFENRSATLRSTTSDRKKKNSIGRFIGRVLSTKHLNQTEGTAAAEESPLLQQEPTSPVPQSPSPEPLPTTPAPSEKSKKGPVTAVNEAVNDMGIFIRRILRPKTPTVDESKEKPSPQRPPPPSRHQTPTPNEKSAITNGKVGLQFDCQVLELDSLH